ncbi:ankyrin repeat-containing domain protein [Trichophaea hybrida]|nr:ankyrin repeat-containing domain protein [Trichophaea hybrida]
MIRAYPTRIAAVVDALDECLTDQMPFLDRVLEISSAADTRGKVRFFLTSREELNISNQLRNHDSVLTLGMKVDDDIKNFVIERVQKLSGLRKFKVQIIEDVPKHSVGMFKYAALLLDQLDSPSTTSIPEMLKSPPKGLNGMYEHILLRLDNQNWEIRKKILYWVGMAKRPLSVEELAYACAVRDDEENFDPSEKRLATEENILSYCSPLIEIVNDTVQFTHLSVREFLLQKGEDFHPFAKSQRIRPQWSFDYSVVNWLLHAARAATEPQEMSTVSRLWDVAVKFFWDESAFQAWATAFPRYIHQNNCMNRYNPGMRPLHIASSYGLMTVAERLISKDASFTFQKQDVTTNSNPDIRDNERTTPPAWSGHEAMTRLLIYKGTDVSTTDRNRKTPLINALLRGHEAVAQLLIDKGAEAMARLLIDKGSDVCAADKHGKTPLQLSARSEDETVTRLLIDNGADVSVTNNDGRTPLHLAIEDGKCNGETLPAPLPLSQLYETLEKKYPGITEKVLRGSMVTVNLDYVDLEEEAERVIKPGDEVAIIPPVSAG